MTSDQSQPKPVTLQPAEGATVASARSSRNTLAIVALVVALLGLLFAVLEGAYILGWILLPIAFVLSLVALVRRDAGRKGVAAGALVVTIIGLIAAPIAFMGSVGRAFEKASGGRATVMVPAASSTSPAAVSPAPATTGGAGARTTSQAPASSAPPQNANQGTRENPYRIGSELANDKWKVKVNSFTPDATQKVLAANQFNSKPAAGTVYALVNVTVTALQDKGSTMEVFVDYVTKEGNVIDRTESTAVPPTPLGLKELYKGASSTGNVALQIPKGDAGLIRIRPGILADEVFVALT